MLRVIDGDVTKSVQADAIVTLINSGGAWYGGVDGAIMRVAGGRYHAQAQDAMPLSDGQVVVAKGNRNNHSGSFNDVVFVVDDLRQPLANLVRKALDAIKQQGYTSVAMPMFRTGVMLGAVEPNAQAVVDQMEKAFSSFNHDKIDITIVVYGDPQVRGLLSNSLTN